ncbi:hypothetical protein Tco_1120999 [Tanacetum coccineum]|uniref:Uncharacterized protein n=1 Tax=Tanacetum coccineum TaxID=301880 RepID=A0ABQ5IWG6_9ASTR
MLGSLQKDDDDEISNLVDLHMSMLGSGWKTTELKAAVKGPAGVAGTMAVASSSSKQIVDFASQIKKACELGESIETMRTKRAIWRNNRDETCDVTAMIEEATAMVPTAPTSPFAAAFGSAILIEHVSYYGTANLLVVLPRNKKDHAMRYPCAQALLHSRIPNDWYRGMDLVRAEPTYAFCSVESTSINPKQKKKEMYLLAVGFFEVGTTQKVKNLSIGAWRVMQNCNISSKVDYG